jgi:disulfide bond formation protein DsbB
VKADESFASIYWSVEPRIKIMVSVMDNVSVYDRFRVMVMVLVIVMVKVRNMVKVKFRFMGMAMVSIMVIVSGMVRIMERVMEWRNPMKHSILCAGALTTRTRPWSMLWSSSLSSSRTRPWSWSESR